MLKERGGGKERDKENYSHRKSNENISFLHMHACIHTYIHTYISILICQSKKKRKEKLTAQNCEHTPHLTIALSKENLTILQSC